MKNMKIDQILRKPKPKKRAVALRVDSGQWERLSLKLEKKQISITDFFRAAIESYLQEP